LILLLRYVLSPLPPNPRCCQNTGKLFGLGSLSKTLTSLNTLLRDICNLGAMGLNILFRATISSLLVLQASTS